MAVLRLQKSGIGIVEIAINYNTEYSRILHV